MGYGFRHQADEMNRFFMEEAFNAEYDCDGPYSFCRIFLRCALSNEWGPSIGGRAITFGANIP
jgi:hypothetical protein